MTMKSVFIVYNQALGERLMQVLHKLSIRGFTQWEDVKGRGTDKGEPHMGSHTWPALNSATMCVVEEQKAKQLLEAVALLNQQAEMQGIKAFAWNVEAVV